MLSAKIHSFCGEKDYDGKEESLQDNVYHEFEHLARLRFSDYEERRANKNHEDRTSLRTSEKLSDAVR